MLLGLQAASTSGIAGSLYYVFVYAFLVLGSFTVIAFVGGRGDRHHEIEGYRGLGKRQPALALSLAILLLAQAGAPFTTGFLAKLYVVQAAVQSHSSALAVVAMLSGAIAAAFYLRVVFVMYASRSAAGATAETNVVVDQPELAEPAAGGPAALALAVATTTAEVDAEPESRRRPALGAARVVPHRGVHGRARGLAVATVRLRPRRPVALLTFRRC